MINCLGLNFDRLGTNHPAGDTDAITADIHQCAAAHFRFQTNIITALDDTLIHVETECRPDQAGIPDGLFIHQLLETLAARMKSVHECFHQQPAGCCCMIRHLPCLMGIAGQRLFTQDVFAG